MSLFHRKAAVLPLPEGFTAEDIRIESSICTGEKTIGFYSPAQKRLLFAELVRSPQDVAAFYRKYGLMPTKQL